MSLSKENKYPEIRFKGFTDDWEQRKLSDYKDVRDGTHDSPKYYKSGHPLVTSKNLKSSGLDMSNISLISTDDFETINKRSKVDKGDILFGMIGTIGNPVIIDRDDFAIKNVALIKDGGNITNRFLIQLFKSAVFDKYIRNENVGNTQKFIGLNKIRNFEFLVPIAEEQYKIGLFLNLLDNIIALHQCKLDKLNSLKIAYLQVLFPEKDKNSPRIRFVNFTKNWEQRKVGEFLSESRISGSNGKVAKKLTVKLWRKGVISKEDMYQGSEATNYYIRKKGQFIYGKLDFLNQAFGIIPDYLDGYESTLDLPSFNISKNLDSFFFIEYISRKQFYLYQGIIANGSRKAKRIHPDTFYNMPLLIPNIKEQFKIGLFFKQIDNTITLHQQKLHKLKELKKAYLKKMFV